MEQIWRLEPKIRFRRVFDEGVLIHQDRAEVMVINEVGLTFLELCDGQRSVAQIIHRMKPQYAVSENELVRDIRSFVAELADEGILLSGEAVQR